MFGSSGKRLQCWPHVNRNVEPRIKALAKAADNAKLGKEVLEDIHAFQWIVSKKSYDIDFQALEDKYLKGNGFNEKEKTALLDFFEYFRKQWGPDSKVKNWFEHANPYHIGHNMGVEGVNKDIKKNHTFKSRVGLGQLFDIVERMLREWSANPHENLLKGERLDHVRDKQCKDGQGLTGLARQTNGYKFAHNYRKGVPNKVATVMPGSRNFHTVASEHDLGEVTQIFGINTKGSTSEILPKVKAKLAERANPSQKSWDEKKRILTSCWLVEERGGDYFCDCYEGIRGRMCEHTVGMHFRNKTGKIPVTDDVRTLPISQKRPRGRPKQLPASCLVRSPPRAPQAAPDMLDVSNEVLLDPAEDEEDFRQPEEVMACTSCQEDGRVVRAVKYCAQCTDQMCTECLSAHSKLRATKHHVLTEPLAPAEQEVDDVPAPAQEARDRVAVPAPEQEEELGEEEAVPVLEVEQAIPVLEVEEAIPLLEVDEAIPVLELEEAVPVQEVVVVPAPKKVPQEAPAQDGVAVPVQEEEEAVPEEEVPAQKEKAAAAHVLPAPALPPPALRGQSKRVSCQLCGRENIDKKSIRKHERSINCLENRLGTAAAQRPAPAAKRTAPAVLSPETSKRPRLPTPSSSTPPRRKTRNRNVN